MKQCPRCYFGDPTYECRCIPDVVEQARRLQRERFKDEPAVFANAHMAARALRRHCKVTPPVEALLRAAVIRLGLSTRAYHRILKIIRTIADLAESPDLELTQFPENPRRFRLTLDKTEKNALARINRTEEPCLNQGIGLDSGTARELRALRRSAQDVAYAR